MKKKKMKNNREIVFQNTCSEREFPIEVYKSFLDDPWGMAHSVAYDNIGIVYIYGPLASSARDGYPFHVSYISIQEKLAILASDEKINHIVLLINSPGGNATGLFSLCDYITSIDKPIHAHIMGEACSAAYAIATCADRITIDKDADTGCCGCYAEVVDNSAILEKYGYKTKVFRSVISPRKNISIFTDKKAEEEFQERIDLLGTEYLRLVADNRGIDYEVALQSFGEGRVVDANYALENNMVDAIDTFENVVKTIVENDSPSPLQGEDEGENMDITKMSKEEKQALFDSLCASEASLLNSVREGERARILELYALKGSNGSVNALVEKAVSEGTFAKDIALELLKAEMTDTKKTENQEALKSMAKATQEVQTPNFNDTEDVIAKAAKGVEETIYGN